jgi:hypothetical protein
LDIKGGNENGYRSWSHKMNFPEDSLGNWQIRVETEAKQVLGILRFQVVTSKSQSTLHAPQKSKPAEPKKEPTELKVESSEPDITPSSSADSSLENSEPENSIQ